MLRNFARGFVIGAGAVLLVSFIAAIAAADQPTGNVCDGLTTGKIDVADGTESVSFVAPPGSLITGYCVKAGSAKQGLGPEYVTVDPPAHSVTITHSSGKDISHFSVSLVEDVSPTPTPTPTPTTTTPQPSPTPTPTPTHTSPTPDPSVTPSSTPPTHEGEGKTPDGDVPKGDTPDTLPKTGGEWQLALAGLALLGMGSFAVWLSRR